MLRKLAMAAVAVATIGGATLGAAPGPTPAPAPKPLPPAPQSYLGDAAPDSYKILPPAPVAGTTRYEADRTMFLGTRRLKDTPRWALALNDDNGPALLKDMSCALGVELTAQNAPKVMSMIPRVARDASRATNVPKDIYKRQRPFLVDEGPICIARSDFLANNPDYPSGHVTYGWTVGLILAELAPDRATEVLVRARAFGESRMVCGVHNMSAVEAGRTNGAIVVAGLHGSAEFRRDLEIARREIAAARKAGPAPDPVACAAEAELLKSPY